jgi:hypothetical protein
MLHPSCILPIEGEEGIKAFPLDGKRLDRGKSLSHMPPFSSSVGERKLMKHSVVDTSPQETQNSQKLFSLP